MQGVETLFKKYIMKNTNRKQSLKLDTYKQRQNIKKKKVEILSRKKHLDTRLSDLFISRSFYTKTN